MPGEKQGVITNYIKNQIRGLSFKKQLPKPDFIQVVENFYGYGGVSCRYTSTKLNRLVHTMLLLQHNCRSPCKMTCLCGKVDLYICSQMLKWREYAWETRPVLQRRSM